MPKAAFIARSPTRLVALPGGPSFEPIIISFNTPRSYRRSQSFMRGALTVTAAFATLCAGILLLTQPLPVAPANAKAAPSFAQEPAPAPPAAVAEPPAIVPLPAQQIASQDFYANRPKPVLPAETVSLIPMLEKLPVGNTQMAKPAPAPYRVEVDNAGPAKLMQRAEKAALQGQREDAIRLYTAALETGSDDAAARHNLVALWLDKAAALDEDGKTDAALKAYGKALAYGGGNAADAIRARIAYLNQQ